MFQGNVSFGSGCILAGIGPHDFKVSTNNNKAPFFEKAKLSGYQTYRGKCCFTGSIVSRKQKLSFVFHFKLRSSQ